MNYNALIDLAADFGYSLSVSGAETYRVEDTILRILKSYGVDSEVFAIPNYLIVSIIEESGKPATRMRRIGSHGTNLDAVERLNALSRSICRNPPPPGEAQQLLKETMDAVPSYGLPMFLAGNFLGALGFALLFGCGLRDMLISGICGLICGLVCRFTDKNKVNFFFSTMTAAFFLAFVAYGFERIGFAKHTDGVIIGALMILVPGLVFTNSMRDIIYRDINSGINRIVEVIMTSMALALGTAAAWNVISFLFGPPVGSGSYDHPLYLTAIGALIGCIGFSILFNIHGPGGVLCALGGVLTWAVYVCAGSNLTGYFFAAVVASVYSEIMARVRKYPTISYLVVSLFPLLPGAGVYYTMYHAVHGSMEAFAAKGAETAAIAGTLAVGVMFVSTIVHFFAVRQSSARI